MIKRGMARRLGINRPVSSEPMDFTKLGVSMAEIIAAWPATMQRLRAVAEKM